MGRTQGVLGVRRAPPRLLRPQSSAFSCGLRRMWMTPKRIRMEVDEALVFRPEWTQRYLVVEPAEGDGALCLVCRRLVASTRERDVRRHYEAEHEFYERFVGDEERAALVERLRQGDMSLAAVLTPEERATRAGLGLCRFLALKGRGWGEGDFVHQCMEVLLREVLPDHVGVLEGIDLSPEITRQRILSIDSNLRSQLFNRARDFKAYSLALDDQAFVAYENYLLVFIRGVGRDLEVQEDLLTIINLTHHFSVGALMSAILEALQTAGLSLQRMVGLTTTHTLRMIGENSGLVSYMREKAVSPNCWNVIHYSGFLHLELLSSYDVDINQIINTISEWVVMIKTRGVRRPEFQPLLTESESEHGERVNGRCLNNWLRRGKTLKLIFSLRKEIEAFLVSVGATTVHFSDKQWLCDFGFLVDIMDYLREISEELQISKVFAAAAFERICTFEGKLSSLQRHMEEVNLTKLQANTDLWNEYRVKDLGQFYAGLSGEAYPIIKGVAYKVASLFDSNQICDKAFAYLTRNQYTLSQPLTDEHLQALFRVATTEMDPRWDDLVRERNDS